MELFWRDGYAGTGVDRLVRRTGASRYGLYTTFGGKRDLFLASLERYSQAVMDPMLEPLEDARASAREIRAFFDRVLGLIRGPGGRRGCLVCNVAFERGAVDPAAARRVRRHFDRARLLAVDPVRQLHQEAVVGLQAEQIAQVAAKAALALDVARVLAPLAPHHEQRRAGPIFPAEHHIRPELLGVEPAREGAVEIR